MNKEILQQILRPPEKEQREERKRPNPLVVGAFIVAIVFLVGSSFGGKPKKELPEEATAASPEAMPTGEDYLRRAEERLAETLEKIQGAGEVYVLITAESSGEKILATDKNQKTSNEIGGSMEESAQEEEQRVVLSEQDTGQSPYVVGEKLPVPGGILVVAQGAKSEAVRYEMYEAVRALFGLPAHRIKITY